MVVTNLEGKRLGEVKDAYERKYTANMSKPSTASFQVRKDNSILPYLFSQEEDYLLQVWQDETIRMWGPILTANLAMTEGAAPSIAVTAADPAWRLAHRFYWGGGAGFALATHDKAYLAEQLIIFQNNRNEGGVDAGTGIGSNGDLCGSTGSYTIPTGKSALVGIQELAQGFDGFDWYIEPLSNSIPEEESHSPYIGIFRAAALVGVEKSDAVFEFGTGRRNMRTVNYLRDQTTRANSALNISEEGLDANPSNSIPIIGKIDKTNWERFGLYEDMAELSGVPNTALREQYTQEVVNVRKSPRRVLAMTSDIDDGTGRVPRFGYDYWLGDTVTARAVVSDDIIFNGNVRVYSVEVSINNNGTSTYTPILVDEGE